MAKHIQVRIKSFYLNLSHLLVAFVCLLLSMGASAGDAIYTGFFSDDAVGGYDTVAYFTEGKPVKGDKRYKVRFMDTDWFFSSAENKKLFEADPDKYRPQYGGFCAWAVSANNARAEGNPKYWTVVDGKLYLNYNKDVQGKWLAEQQSHIERANVAWPKLLAE